MTYLTEKKAAEFANKRQVLNESIVKSARETEKDVFLSHSSADKEHLAGVIAFLEAHGASVYIDKEDAELPGVTSQETARILKSRILKCKKFIILVSVNSKDSRWVPWELGIADGGKPPKSTAVLPLSENDDQSRENWPRQEYIGLYQYIGYFKWNNLDKREWMVCQPVGTDATALSEWLKT